MFTGSYAINQLNGYEMPIWVADFVLMDVGTGGVVGVPGHDRRDFEFAKKFGLPIKRVVIGKDGDASEISKPEQVQEDEGKMVNSEFLNGLDIHRATMKMMDYLEEKDWGKRETNYHLRDWLISRQRYWGPPIPMIYCKSCAKAGKSWFESHPDENNTSKLLHKDQTDWNSAGWYPEENVPVALPDIDDYKPDGTGRGPLANHSEFYNVKCPSCGKKARRETDVSDTFLDSSWYFLRYPSVDLKDANKVPFDDNTTKKWLPVSLYFGGAEHAVLHLMYARFITMFLNESGYLNFSEPFPWFFAHGLMIKDGAKMSKSRGNVVNPDEYVKKFGADTLRLYEMFLGPMDGYPDFRDTGIEGMQRFVERVWELFGSYKNNVVVSKSDASAILIKMHQTIKKVTDDIESFRYNTAIASIMEFVNLLRDVASKSALYVTMGRNYRCAEWDLALKNLSLLIAPFIPHMAEEIWCNLLENEYSIHKTKWPKFNEELVEEKIVKVVVQINGKVRTILSLDNEKAKNKNKVISEAKNDKRIKSWLIDKNVKKEIFVPSKLINFVTD